MTGEYRIVTDPADPVVADYIGLRKPDRRIAMEAAGGFFIGEGFIVVERLLASTREVRSVLVSEPQVPALADLLAARPDVDVFVVTAAVLREISGFDLHRGVLASVNRFPLPESDALLARFDRLLFLERIADHENLGSLFRSAAALGFGAVVLCPECADPLYRRVVRVSMGAAALLPYGRLREWPKLDVIRSHGHRAVALTPHEPSTSIERWTPPSKVVLMVGTEGPGLRAEVIAAADERVRISMHGGLDSLNVATAAAIAMHHAITEGQRLQQ